MTRKKIADFVDNDKEEIAIESNEMNSQTNLKNPFNVIKQENSFVLEKTLRPTIDAMISL